MKKILNSFLIAVMALAVAGCEKKNPTTTEEVMSEKEKALQTVMAPYVNHTVIATYSHMADEGLQLLELCQAIQAKVEAGEDYADLMVQAGEAWRAMRVYWEQSEAFLYGPASIHNIDPHIDSWPLDYNAMNDLLNDASRMAKIEEEGGAYVGDKLGYGLKGFHAAEYLLFTEQHDGKPHATNLTKAEAIYLVGIVEDLTQQAILLEDSWCGGITNETKLAIIAEEEPGDMSFGMNYGDAMLYPTVHSPFYKTYQAAAEEIIAGCVDIANEVSTLKLGNPYSSSNAEEAEYIESPYSCTSVIDFKDNILSIKHAYAGAQQGDACIADFVKAHNSDLNDQVLAAIDKAIEEIGLIQNFETQAKGDAQVKKAMDACAALRDLLDKEVMALIVE